MFPVPVVRSVLMERAMRTRLPQMSLGGHFGPKVDAACLAEEPAVDRWEAGVEYPSWEQTVALARFLDVRVRDLAHPDAEPGTTRSVDDSRFRAWRSCPSSLRPSQRSQQVPAPPSAPHTTITPTPEPDSGADRRHTR